MPSYIVTTGESWIVEVERLVIADNEKQAKQRVEEGHSLVMEIRHHVEDNCHAPIDFREIALVSADTTEHILRSKRNEPKFSRISGT